MKAGKIRELVVLRKDRDFGEMSFPLIADRGVVWAAQAHPDRISAREIEICKDFLLNACKPGRHYVSSYSLKHMAEHFFGLYVSNGAFISAAIECAEFERMRTVEGESIVEIGLDKKTYEALDWQYRVNRDASFESMKGRYLAKFEDRQINEAIAKSAVDSISPAL